MATIDEDAKAKEAVFVNSQLPTSAPVEQIDLDKLKRPLTVDDVLGSMRTMGFQATEVVKAVDIINNMRAWRDPENPDDRTTVFLGYTSNLISSGLRGYLQFLVKHNHVSCIVTTAGGIEEDFIKCLGKTYMGSFTSPGAELRAKGQNRIGNLIVPNDNYCKFEDWIIPIFDKMLEEQEESRITGKHVNVYGEEVDGWLWWTPSNIIARLGKEINNEESVYYWAYKNKIPVFCPALTDGSIGDMLYFHSFKSSPQTLDVEIGRDIRRINTIAVRAKRTGMVILGGGVVKHHIANANLFRNGADYAIYINTAQEFDGSDAGARPDEAVSWGKIKAGAETVKVYQEATACFPWIVAATFAKDTQEGEAAKA